MFMTPVVVARAYRLLVKHSKMKRNRAHRDDVDDYPDAKRSKQRATAQYYTADCKPMNALCVKFDGVSY